MYLVTYCFSFDDLMCTDSCHFGAQLEKEVIVDRFCGMAVLRGADVFASGLLAMSGSK